MSFLKQLFGNLMSGHGGNKHGGYSKHGGGGKHGGFGNNPQGGNFSNAPQITCSKCNSTNAAGAKFCNSCGTTLAGGFCSGCGQALKPDAKFCGQCGKQQS